MKDGVLYFTTTVGYCTELMRLTGDQLEKAVAFNGAISGFDLTDSGFVFCAMEPGRLQEVYAADAAGNNRRTHADQRGLPAR